MKPGTPQTAAAAPSASDAELVLAARRGDRKAFVEIVARHQAMVCGIALGILGDFAASEDAGQEAFLAAWRRIHELREPERLRAWLGQIARNAALGQLRRKKGHETLDEDLPVADSAPTPDEIAATDEEAALVRDSLKKLPEDYRLPLVLYYREGQSVRAVAEALGISEDAAKQRLARGREMLRDRMSGLIETVLTRTKPGAVFTMAIAAAIGALAAPSAVAGTAFAAASTAGTTASTTPLVAAMSTSKALLVAACVVAALFIPIGYRLSAVKAPAPPPVVVAAPAPTETAAPAAPTAPSFGSSALFAEWRELHHRYGTNAQAMPALYDAINKLKDPFHKQGFMSALMAEWVEVDPKGGLTYFLGKVKSDSQRHEFFMDWFAADPTNAVKGLLTGAEGWDGIARDCLTNIVRVLPAAIPQIAAQLPKAADTYYDHSVWDAFALLAQNGLAAARQSAENLTGPNRDEALAGIAQVWAKSDLNADINWAKGLPDGTDRDEIIRAALIGKASVDPATALNLVGTVPSGGRNAYFASTTGARVLEQAGEANFDAVAAWLAANPGRLSSQDLEGIAHPVTQRLNTDAVGFLTARSEDGSLTSLVPAIESALLNQAGGQRQAVWEWLQTQPDNDTIKNLREEVIRSAAWQDPPLALQLAAQLPNTPEGDSEMKMLAQSALNGGRELSRFDQMMQEAPERLKQPLLECAFDDLGHQTLGEPQSWIARLNQLPESARPQGTADLAGAWASQVPEEATAWALSLPAGEAQNKAVGAIATAWAANDPQSAASWVESLPAGPERDHGAESLVGAVANEYPREAWDWALSISDPTERESAATQAIKTLGVRDPATAQQLIASSPFPEETRSRLEQALPKTPNTR